MGTALECELRKRSFSVAQSMFQIGFCGWSVVEFELFRQMAASWLQNFEVQHPSGSFVQIGILDLNPAAA